MPFVVEIILEIGTHFVQMCIIFLIITFVTLMVCQLKSTVFLDENEYIGTGKHEN
jgi:hypothetical protein